MERSGRRWTPEEDRLLIEKAAAGWRLHHLMKHLGRSRVAIISRAVALGVKIASGAKAHPAGTCRFVFATGVEKPKQVTIYAQSIEEAKARARAQFPAAGAFSIQSVN